MVKSVAVSFFCDEERRDQHFNNKEPAGKHRNQHLTGAKHTLIQNLNNKERQPSQHPVDEDMNKPNQHPDDEDEHQSEQHPDDKNEHQPGQHPDDKNDNQPNQHPDDEDKHQPVQHPDDEERQPDQHPDDEERRQADSDQREAARLLADNFLSYLAALLFYLTVGLSLSPLSAALAATGRSGEPRRALRRYVSTARHIIAWHLGDPLGDPRVSQAASSAAQVVRAHAEAVRRISDGVTFPAGDMRTVQTAFVAFALLHRRLFAVRFRGDGTEAARERQLMAYTRHWHRIGLALGMAESDSALAGDLRSCRSACADVQLRLLASLQSPPPHFLPLAYALAGGVLLVTRLPVVSSPPAMVAVFLDAAGAPAAMRRRALAAVGYRPVRDAWQVAVLRCLLHLLGWAPRWLHRQLFARACSRMGLHLPDWWRLEHAAGL